MQQKLGEIGYKVAYSLVSLAGVVLIAKGYGTAYEARAIQIYTPPVWLSHLTLLFMIPAFIFFVAAYVPCRIKKALKHPMLVAVKLWAFSHLLANGDLASLLLFGSFLAWAVVDRISVKKRGLAGGLPDDVVPVRFGDAIVILIGLAAYALFAFKLHPWLIGVPVA
ncbi:NnrU family protein [Roseibium denhamense]